MLLVVLVVALLPFTLAGPMFDVSLVAQLQTRLDKGEASETVFQDFKGVFKKTYDSDGEENLRMKIFQVNVDYIHQHNVQYAKGDKSYSLGVNQFADMTHKEFLLQYTSRRPMERPGNGSLFLTPSNIQVPSSVDWRNKGYVTPVKNQGQCGSCWAFSTTGSMEGQVFRATGTLVSLSEQQLVDCSRENLGCKGGLMDKAFDYIRSAGGLEQEQVYPYTATDGTCTFNKTKVVQGSSVSGYVDVSSGSETDLQQAVASVGPISIAIDASSTSFQFYSEGIYYEPSCKSGLHDLDHAVLAVGYAVLAVGYGADNDREFWIVKNSWNTTWGESGYIRMARNKGNNCGVATLASYPLLTRG